MIEPCSRVKIGKRKLPVRLSGRLAINKGGDCESGPDPSISKDGRRVLVRCITPGDYSEILLLYSKEAVTALAI